MQQGLFVPFVLFVCWIDSLAANDLSPCTCSCCEAEPHRGDNPGVIDRFECAYAQPGLVYSSPFRSKDELCTPLCRQDPADSVVTATEVVEMDTQRFCFFECEPLAPPERSPTRGDLCGHLSSVDAQMVKDQTGNARPPMERPHVMMHFLAHRRSSRRTLSAVATSHAGSKQAPLEAPVGASMPNGDAASVAPWSSIASPAEENSAYIVQLEQEGHVSAEEAAKDGAEVKGEVVKAAGLLIEAIASSSHAKEAAEKAHEVEATVRGFRDRVVKEARVEAIASIPAILGEMKQKEQAKADVEFEQKRALARTDMLRASREAGVRAMRPYQDAQKRAAASAWDYATRGDERATQSIQFQQLARMYEAQANQWAKVGDQKQAQKYLLQSRVIMNQALDLNSQANADYNTASSVMDTLPQYGTQASAAAWHAQVMVDPDAPPPPEPLV